MFLLYDNFTDMPHQLNNFFFAHKNISFADKSIDKNVFVYRGISSSNISNTNYK